jgi:hypothetical protein
MGVGGEAVAIVKSGRQDQRKSRFGKGPVAAKMEQN